MLTLPPPLMSDLNAAWTAGLFEGEGYVGARQINGKGYYAEMVVQMTDKDVIERFHHAVGCGSIRLPKIPDKTPHHKQLYRWTVSGWAPVSALYDQWLPYLGQRRRATFEGLFETLACTA